MTPKQERAEARKALEAATPGPWYQLTVDDDSRMQMEVVATEKQALAGYLDDDFDPTKIIAATMVQRPEYVANEKWIENAYLIANAPTWLRNSLDREEQLIAKVKELNESVQETQNDLISYKYKSDERIEQLIAENAKLRENMMQQWEDWGNVGKSYVERIAEQDKEIQRYKEVKN